ncbi:MAG: DUF5069 domain-containing protein, partial [Luteolibacter sp.]
EIATCMANHLSPPLPLQSRFRNRGSFLHIVTIPSSQFHNPAIPSPTMDIPAIDLTQTFPRSPRDTSIGGYVVAARCVDKCRAVLNGTAGEYHSGCPLDEVWLDFAGIKYKAFHKFVSSGADDAAISDWVTKKSKQKKRSQVIAWNNKMRDYRISKMDMGLQEFLEDYIPENIPAGKIVRVWFDVYDIEENRI